MPHIPYVNPSSITDAEILGYLERARQEGTPRPESQASPRGLVGKPAQSREDGP